MCAGIGVAGVAGTHISMLAEAYPWNGIAMTNSQKMSDLSSIFTRQFYHSIGKPILLASAAASAWPAGWAWLNAPRTVPGSRFAAWAMVA